MLVMVCLRCFRGLVRKQWRAVFFKNEDVKWLRLKHHGISKLPGELKPFVKLKDCHFSGFRKRSARPDSLWSWLACKGLRGQSSRKTPPSRGPHFKNSFSSLLDL